MRRSEGFLLVTVLFITVVLVLLALGTSFTSLIDRQVAARQRGGTEAFYLAQAGMEHLKTAVFAELGAIAGRTDACGPPQITVDIGIGGEPLLEGALSQPIRLQAGQNGWYQLRFVRSRAYYVLTAVGYLAAAEDAAQRAAQSTIQLVAAAGPGISGVWDNAIFTPSLSKREGGDLTGTIAAYGSVHIVNGEVTLESSESLAASGSSGIFNNYRGRATGTQTDVTAAALAALGDFRTNEPGLDLCSRLKIAQGSVRVQSSAVGIGAAGDLYDGDDWGALDPVLNQVQSIEGIYLGSGSVVDQRGNEVPVSPDAGLYSRSGVAGYEGFEDIRFPPLPVGFPSGGSVINEAGCSLVVDGVLQLPPTALDSFTCTSVGVSDDGTTPVGTISWNEETQVLELDGRVSFPSARLVITPRANGDILRYSGSGEIQIGSKTESGSTGQVAIGMQILPENAESNYDPDALAIVTAGNLLVEGITGTNNVLSALLYAEGQARFRQQVTMVGAVVAGSVDVEQVPAFLHHPDIGKAAAALGLIGSDPDALGRGVWSEVSTEVRD